MASKIVRAFLSSPTAIIALVGVAIISIVAVVAPWFLSDRADSSDPAAAALGSSWEHPFGTDQLGRDVFARTLVATRLTLQLGVSATLIGAVPGIAFGALMATVGPRFRRFLQQSLNALLAFPPLLVSIIVIAIIGPGSIGAVVGVGISMAFFFARLSGNLALSVVGADYVSAAKVLGISRVRITLRHVLPNVMETLLISVTNMVALSIVIISGLSFLGLGVQAPEFDWGSLLTEGVRDIFVNPASALGPGVVIAFAATVFGYVGDSLARAANPLLWTAGPAKGRTRTTKRLRPVDVSRPARPQRDEPLPTETEALLRTVGLDVSFPDDVGGRSSVVRQVSFTLEPAEIVGIVGESGSGKSTTALALAQLIEPPGVVNAEQLELEGQQLLRPRTRALRRFLGTRMAMVFQEPLSSFNPALKIGTQLTEPAMVHKDLNRRAARTLAVERLGDVQLPAPQRHLRQYPHELSGGMLQRTMIGMGLMTEPTVIIADEPTTALDVTVQAEILSLLRTVNETRGTAMLVISHDIGVIAEVASRVLVMYAGRIVEDVALDRLVEQGGLHPYTSALLSAVPDVSVPRTTPLTTIPGRPPQPESLPTGCAYAPRCPHKIDRCEHEDPPLVPLGAGHRVACWVAAERAQHQGESARHVTIGTRSTS